MPLRFLLYLFKTMLGELGRNQGEIQSACVSSDEESLQLLVRWRGAGNWIWKSFGEMKTKTVFGEGA